MSLRWLPWVSKILLHLRVQVQVGAHLGGGGRGVYIKQCTGPGAAAARAGRAAAAQARHLLHFLAKQLPETNLGGTLQLLVDLKFIAGAFSPLSLYNRLLGGEGCMHRGIPESPADRLVQACRTIAKAALKDSRMKLSCFCDLRGGAGSAASASRASGRSALSTRSSGA
ncbi:hypothetical protein COCOBI_12-0820 [Coccomyxa sp. Obi]|nr:hypothetical protein COCOBI_12-0820 [Coccomyxa sp. Obi]